MFKVFTEWKSTVKKKARNIKDEIIGTGGGPRTQPQLTALEERLISVLGQACIDGVMDSVEEAGFDSAIDTNENLPECSSKIVSTPPVPKKKAKLNSDSQKSKMIASKTKELYEQKSSALLDGIKDIKENMLNQSKIFESIDKKVDERNEILMSIDMTLKNIFKVKVLEFNQCTNVPIDKILCDIANVP